MTDDESLTIVELRRCLRDVFALAMLPVLWRRNDAKHTTDSLADAIFRTLRPELVYVLVPDSPGAHASVRDEGDRRHDPEKIAELFAPIIDEGRSTSRMDVLGTEMNVHFQTIELQDRAFGAIVVAASRSSFPTDIECALLRVAANQAAVALQNARHVAELDQAAKLREELVAELAAASRRKDRFLAVLGHELRNPLAAIHAAHMYNVSNREHDRAQEIITHQLETLMRLVDDLLDISRVATGKLALQKQRLDLRDVVERARAASEHAAIQRGHRFVSNACDVPLWVDGDAVRLEQVLVNLVGNAVRYTPAGGRVSLAASRDSDGNATLRVEDDGCGIAPDLLPRIFEPFVQAEMPIHRADGGLGLGLALVKGVIDLHGGSVVIASAGSGKGCTVTVRLPLVEPLELKGVDAPVLLARSNAKLRVLLVDDNAEITEMLAAWLEDSGHETASATDGLKAIDLAVRFSPDVALVDIGLPTIDGYEVARRLRTQLQKSVVLVAVSGYGQEEDRVLSREAGFDDHLVKPVRTERIERILAKAAVSRP
jgi:signal transduction histidine kinase/ActR/RegA family two-component response regulator